MTPSPAPLVEELVMVWRNPKRRLLVLAGLLGVVISAVEVFGQSAPVTKRPECPLGLDP